METSIEGGYNNFQVNDKLNRIAYLQREFDPLHKNNTILKAKLKLQRKEFSSLENKSLNLSIVTISLMISYLQ